MERELRLGDYRLRRGSFAATTSGSTTRKFDPEGSFGSMIMPAGTRQRVHRL